MSGYAERHTRIASAECRGQELNAFFGNRCSQIVFDDIQRYNGILKRITLDYLRVILMPTIEYNCISG